jgi:predicted flap endonuclease-1-like 5' DNA nuclease
VGAEPQVRLGSGVTILAMKRLARVLGFVGGAAAIVWAMRDRFVSIAAPREPQPPSFRVVTDPARPPAPATASHPGPDDLTEINGIGPVFARRLMEAGVTTFGELASATAETLAEVTGVTEARASDWVVQAGART